jgi:hypothetical protein
LRATLSAKRSPTSPARGGLVLADYVAHRFLELRY